MNGSLKEESARVWMLLVGIAMACAPVSGTISIPTNTSVGTWDSVNRIYTLTTDASDTIQIDEDNLTLDGDGYKLGGGPWQIGVYVPEKSGVTIKNCRAEFVQDGGRGIYLWYCIGASVIDNTIAGNTTGIDLTYCSECSVQGNTTCDNWCGIHLWHSDGTAVVGNTASGSSYGAIALDYSSGNTLRENVCFDSDRGIGVGVYSSSNTINDNTVYGNYHGVLLHWWCTDNLLTDNTTHGNNSGIWLGSHCDDNLVQHNDSTNNTYGIGVSGAANNTICENTVSSNHDGIDVYNSINTTVSQNSVCENTGAGIVLDISAKENTVVGNVITDNGNGLLLYASSGGTVRNNVVAHNTVGIYLDHSPGNVVYNNSFIENITQAYAYLSGTTIYNLDKPIGGNFWSNWTTPDHDHDGFVDSPYIFDKGQDNLPWAVPGPWANQPPVADAGDDQTTEATCADGGEVLLDGSGSSDPDSTPETNDDIVSFDWYEDGMLLGSGETITCLLTVGNHTVTLVVTDSQGQTDNDEVTITVQDTTAPTIDSVSVEPDVLWPPDHKMKEVVVTVEVEDLCDPAPVCRIEKVTSNEPIDGPGDGSTEPDWQITGDLTVNLRAERAGVGMDRVYAIHVECTDVSGNTVTATVDVTVPHDQR